MLNYHNLNILLFFLIFCFSLQIGYTKKNPNIYPLDQAYYRPNTLYKEMQEYAKQYPNIVKLHTLGYSTNEKLPIYALQIQAELQTNPVLLVGQHHGDEVIGIQIVMAFAKYMLGNPNNTRIKQLLENYSFWIVPTLNPEGWRIVTSNIYQWKRKNNSDTNCNKQLDYPTDGVDLNRNYPTFWELDIPLSENHPYFKGLSPASQDEIKAILTLAEKVQFKLFFSYHSSVTGTYNEKIYLPWQDKTKKKQKQDFSKMREIAEFYAQNVPKDYFVGNYFVHRTQTSKIGNSRNHFYHTYGTYSYDIEVGGVNKTGVSVVHPKAEIMQKTVSRHVLALTSTLLFALEILSQ